MAEEAQDTETAKTEPEATSPVTESQIKDALRSRVGHFKEQAEFVSL